MSGAAVEAESGRVYTDRKNNIKTTLDGLLEEYNKVLIVQDDNVGSNQMHQIRRALRGKAVVLMGKNTLVRFIITARARNSGNTKLNSLAGLCKTNVGLVFTNENLKTVRDLLLDNRVEAPARTGALAPCDVVVPAGPTGLEPTMTSFFQALSVPTKINKGSIEILSDVELIKKGDKCGASEVALLSKLNIRPFSYGLSVEPIWDNGVIYSPSALDISEDDVVGVIQHCLASIAAFSLQTGYLTTPAVPHLLVNGFKNLAAVAIATEYSFPQAEKLKEAIKNPSAFAAAPAAAAPAAAAKGGKAKEPEPEPEEEDADMGFSLFD